MLKRIAVTQVRLGMYIQELGGSWIDHPFWRKSFKLEDPAMLKALQTSPIKDLVIDVSKGLDVLNESGNAEAHEAHEAAPLAPSAEAESPSPGADASPAPAIKRISAEQERARAKKLLKASKQAITSMFNEVRMGQAVNAADAMPLVEEITASVSRNEGALISLVRLKHKDDYTYMHSVAVCALMVALSRQLGMDDKQTKQAGLAGLLHDIGKSAIPLDILNKPGKLTDEEFDIVRGHPKAGHEILLASNGVDEVALDVCLHHHEKVDGTGYPHKLPNDEISIFAKMGAVCDVYDAVTSNRPYKEGWEPGVSLQRMAQWSKTHFDDRVFKAFVKSVGIYPIGSMVMLQSGRLGVVVDQNPVSLLKPLVKVFFSTKSRTRIPVEVLDLSKPAVQDKIMGHEDPILWGIEDIHELWSQ
ncbi:HD-GYP domain-containing protein [Methylovorus sp. MP688]|uniref:HD-GYP domain-containing protein n=1 Tax=Methylovorus sp. (strain MP688) TaxID=887061 RepID=UPI0001EC4354|nr:HD-GYP domain-containing protein [Methylovorus sp. MP688]ADQ83377.1 metal dependent phosphohydrolase [Methylovorus sp. MP688]